jgi:hypothetical protein
MMMYAASTLVMNHGRFVQSLYSTKAPAMILEREMEYLRTFPTNAPRNEIGEQILSDLGLAGAHRVSGWKDGKPLVIDRQHAFAPQRITWDPGAHKLVVEKQEFRSSTFLERMHRRRGYQQPYALDDIWAFSVDVATVAMVFWSVSGLWLWWELRATRVFGAACGLLGFATFILFLILL